MRLIFRYSLHLLMCAGTVLGRNPIQEAPREVRIPIAKRQASTIPVPQGTSLNNVSTLDIVLHGFEGCSENSFKWGSSVDWERWIIDGFIDHDTMSMSIWHGPEDLGYPYVDWNTAAAIEYFGPAYKNKQYRDQIQANLDRHADMGYAWFFGWRLHVRCDDPKNQCLFEGSKTEAYTIHGDFDDQCSPYEDNINFCPAYFRLPSLAQAMQPPLPSRNYLLQYWNRAAVWAHEVMHVTWLMSPIDSGEPHMRDIAMLSDPNWKAYRMIECKFLSFGISTPGPNDPFNNPQNYAWFLLANYVTKQLGWYPSQSYWYSYMDPPKRGTNLLDNEVEIFDTVDAAGTTCRPTAVSEPLPSFTTVFVTPVPAPSSAA